MVGTERTFAMIKPHAFGNADKIFKLVIENGFNVTTSTTLNFNSDIVKEFYVEHVGKHFYENLCATMCEGPLICFVLEGDNVIKKWREFIGPTNVKKALIESPSSLRALFGDITNTAKNAVHGSDSVDSAEREIQIVNKFMNAL